MVLIFKRLTPDRRPHRTRRGRRLHKYRIGGEGRGKALCVWMFVTGVALSGVTVVQKWIWKHDRKLDMENSFRVVA